MYAEFAKIAEQNEYAWNYGRTVPSKEVIATVTEKNRMICFPCTRIWPFIHTKILTEDRSVIDECIQQRQPSCKLRFDFNKVR